MCKDVKNFKLYQVETKWNSNDNWGDALYV